MISCALDYSLVGYSSKAKISNKRIIHVLHLGLLCVFIFELLQMVCVCIVYIPQIEGVYL